jgi:hypothetical protein
MIDDRRRSLFVNVASPASAQKGLCVCDDYKNRDGL